MNTTINNVIEEVTHVLRHCNPEEYQKAVELFATNTRFFFAGEGRSGLIAKMIAMRLMHSGKTVFVIGETTTPSIHKGDILIIISGSGNTPQIGHIGQLASTQGAYVFAVTTSQDMSKQPWCNAALVVGAATKYRRKEEPATIQPLGNQFDQSVHLLLDAAIIDSLAEGQTNDVLRKNHANLE
jgi:6-phospho-3-hexuloisomerase